MSRVLPIFGTILLCYAMVKLSARIDKAIAKKKQDNHDAEEGLNQWKVILSDSVRKDG